MCILCVIQKWSRRVATMLPWLVIPLIGLWALSQLLPAAFRFEITSPRLACVFVLLVTLFWYEILVPQLSAWRVRRNARLRERKRFEAIEMQKLRKTATRRCRNCYTPYRDQNPGGGKFMCLYCGHVSKRPVLDLPVPPRMGLSNSGILKNLVGKGGRILNGKAWSDNGWMCGQDWLDNGDWAGGSFAGKSSYWQKNGGGIFGGENDCLTEKSYSRVVIFACKVLMDFFLGITWLWRKIFRVSSSGDDGLRDAECRAMLDKRGENGASCNESRGEKARRKAEEKRQARLEKELLEEEERKQRLEVARLVEERRRLRDEKMEAEKERGKGSPTAREKDSKKDAKKKHQERRKERDRESSKSNSDAEELEKKASKESERNRKSEIDRREHNRAGAESGKFHGAEAVHGFKGAATNNYYRGNAGTRYLDRMKGTFLSSSRAFTGSSFFGKGSNALVSISREHSASRREFSELERVSGKSNITGDNKNINRPVLIESQPCTTPKKSWHQLFTRSSTVTQPSNTNVISRPNGKPQGEVQSPPFTSHPPSTQAYDSPINFGLPSLFTMSSYPYGLKSTSSVHPLAFEASFPRIGKGSRQFLPEETEIFEDPCYVPDPLSLLGPVSESLDNFQLDLGFVTDTGLEKPRALKSIPASPEVNRPSPIESPMSRVRIPEEKHASSFLFPIAPKAQDVRSLPTDDSRNANEGTWQMWNSSPLGQDTLGLIGDPANWILPPEMNRLNKEDITHPVPQKTMASLFKKDENVHSGTHSPQQVVFGNSQNDGTFDSVLGPAGDTWSSTTLFGLTSGSENYFSVSQQDVTAQNEMVYGNSRARKDWTAGEGVGTHQSLGPLLVACTPPPRIPDVQSLWSYD